MALLGPAQAMRGIVSHIKRHPLMHRTLTSLTQALTLVLALTAPLVSAQEWSQFRGKSAQGIADAPELPATFTEKNVLWRAPTGGTGHSSPVLWGKRLFLTRTGDKANSREVACFDAENGKELWSHECVFETYHRHQLNNAASSTPAVDADGIYIVWSSGKHLDSMALDHSGKELWRRRLGAFKSLHGCGSSPILHGNRVILANDNMGEESFLMALNKKTGEIDWQIKRQSADRRTSYSCPVLYDRNEQTPLILFTSQSHGLTAVNPETGKVNWELDLGFSYRVVATPSLFGDKLFCSSGTNGGGKQSAFVSLPQDKRDKPEIQGKMRRAIPYVPSSLAVNGRVFTFSDGGVASCLDPRDGKVLWRQRTSGTFFSSPVSNGQVIYIPTKEGILLSVSGDEEWQELGSFDLGGSTFSTPAIADNVMFLRTDSELVALGAVPEKAVKR